jgi:hypothetical protein
MPSIRKSLIFVALMGFALAIAVGLTFAPAASAQTMGEYGVTMGNAAASAGAAPAMAPDVGGNFKVSTQNTGRSGSSQSVEIREGDSKEAAAPKVRAHGEERDAGNPGDDWVQVK